MNQLALLLAPVLISGAIMLALNLIEDVNPWLRAKIWSRVLG